MEESARKLEESRDRWGALAQGLRADLDLDPGPLARDGSGPALTAALESLEEALRSALEAAASAPASAPPGLVASLEAALAQLEAARS